MPSAFPVTPATAAVVHVITAPLVGLTIVMFVDAGEQIVGELFVTVNTGFGLTTTLTFCVVPVQVTPAFVKLGVTAYVTVIGAFVVFVNVCAIVAPFPFNAPVVPPAVTTQLNTVPATVLLNAIFEVSPLHKLSSLFVIVTCGVGFTTTFTVCVGMVQPFAVILIT